MEAGRPCFAFVRVIRDPVARTGPMNMALDETLLDSLGGDVVLRLYEWTGPSVSFGYFEPSASARRIAAGRPVVRRWTGGGIVEHGEDLTYSLCVPRTCTFAALRSTESYRQVHAAVAAALARCGVAAEPHAAAAIPPAADLNACFERPVLHDVVADGRKVAGGAQRRNRTGLLHQGSVRPRFAAPADLVAWKRAMRRELPDALGERCQEGQLTPQDLARANALATAKYADAAWTNRC